VFFFVQNIFNFKFQLYLFNMVVDGLALPMEMASVARMATVKPHGWVHVSLGMGGARPFC
jgi:hypothetical protein